MPRFPLRSFLPLSISRQFLLACSAILLIGMLVGGLWLGRQIEATAVNRAAAIAAVYAESILAVQLGHWSGDDLLDSDAHAALDRLFVEGPLKRKVVRFKLWDGDGRIVYSSDHAQQGRRFPVQSALAAAFEGEVQARISRLEQADNFPERSHWLTLLEVYVPVRTGADQPVTAVAEFYHTTEGLFGDIRIAQQRSWILVVIATLAAYLALRGLARRADDTILDQQHDLQRQLVQLRAALDDNERMRTQLGEAGARTTALSEELLHRVAADLHDGPAQKIAFALMRFDEPVTGPEPMGDARSVQGVLRSSLEDLRNIAAGLGLPGIGALSLGQTIQRAVRDVERQSRCTVDSQFVNLPDAAPLALKITVYRMVQESLNNCVRHAPGSAMWVHAGVYGVEPDTAVLIEISDDGPGFDPAPMEGNGRLGLAFLQERVRLLGGAFEIDTSPGRGAVVRARLPLIFADIVHDHTHSNPAG